MVDFNLVPLLPELFLSIAAMGLLIVGVNGGNITTRVICWAGMAALGIALIILLIVGGQDGAALNGMFKFSSFTQFFKIMTIVGLMTLLGFAAGALKDEGIERFEFPVLVMLAGIGMLLIISTNNFLSFYMALELQSLSLYVLAAMRRNSSFSAEAGVKYFTLGALSSGLILFGISLIYGFTGSVDFSVIQSTLVTWGAGGVPMGVTFGLVFLLAGLAFKISAAPFHMWTPDVYQGAPTIVTTFFAMVPKFAMIAIFMRILFEPFAVIQDQWGQVVYVMAFMSMAVGAFGALKQTDVKRLLAYSWIGHMGYGLIGVLAMSTQGVEAVAIYFFIYMIMTAGAFGVLLSLRKDGYSQLKIDDFGGLSKTHPWLAYTMAVMMFSMAGIPPMAGFFGKLFIFQAAIESQMYVLAVAGVLTSVVSAYYYLKIIKVMFFDDVKDGYEAVFPATQKIIMAVSVAFIVFFITKPSALVDFAKGAVSGMFTG